MENSNDRVMLFRSSFKSKKELNEWTKNVVIMRQGEGTAVGVEERSVSCNYRVK